nr:YbaK/EbsC family protein [Actinomycetota bacterium]
MKGALDVHRALLARDVPHEIVRLRGTTVATADDLPRALGVETASCVAVRCYVTDVGVVAALVAADRLPEPAALLDAVGGRTLRAATADEVNAATDYTAGLVSPVCLPSEVRLVADAGLAVREVVYCPVGESGVVLGVRTADLLAVTGAQAVPLSRLPVPRSGGVRAP